MTEPLRTWDLDDLTGPAPTYWPDPPLTVAPAVPVVDHDLVRELRREVAEALAARLQAEPMPDPAARRELTRSLLADALAARAVDRLHAGEPAWEVAEEYALAEAVMAALFGLGRLQPLVDDPLVENIEVNGYDRVWVSYADGREEPGPPVADSDEELLEHLQLLAARVGGSERTFTTANPRLHLRWMTGRGWRRWRGRPRVHRSWCAGIGSATSTSTTWSRWAPWTRHWWRSCARPWQRGRTSW